VHLRQAGILSSLFGATRPSGRAVLVNVPFEKLHGRASALEWKLERRPVDYSARARNNARHTVYGVAPILGLLLQFVPRKRSHNTKELNRCAPCSYCPFCC
jgi:hypothetical protein